MKFHNFFLFLWVVFALLDPDPGSESESSDLIESGFNPFPDPKNWLYFIRNSKARKSKKNPTWAEGFAGVAVFTWASKKEEEKKLKTVKTSTRRTYQNLLKKQALRSLDVHPGSRIRIFSIPDPNSFHPRSRIRIKEFGYFKLKKLFLSSRKYDPVCSSRIRIVIFTHPGSRG